MNSVLDVEPLGFWRLDDTSSTTAADISDQSNDGSYFGTVTHGITGPLSTDTDKAVTLGTSAGINAPVSGGAPSGSDPVTVEAWINAGSFVAGATRPIVAASHHSMTAGSQNGIWSLSLSPTSSTAAKLVANVNGSSETSSATLSPSHWYFVALTDDGTTQNLYVNGVLDSTFASTSSKVAGLFTIGYIPGFSTTPQLQIPPKYFNGKLADVALFDTALADSDISSQYAAATDSASGAGCEDILGATDSSYSPTSDDHGASVQAVVSVYGDDGSATADTSASYASTGVANPWPDGSGVQLGAVIDSGTVLDNAGMPIAGATVSLYPNPAVQSVLRPAALATTTTDANGNYAISLANTGLVASLAVSGWMNLTREITGGGYIASTGISRSYDNTANVWDDGDGAVGDTTTVLDPLDPTLVVPSRTIGPQGCIPITTKLATTDDKGSVGEANSWSDDTAGFSYGASRSADTWFSIDVSPNGSSNWSISGSSHITNSAGWNGSWSGQWGHVIYQKFRYEKDKVQVCTSITYKARAIQYDGSWGSYGNSTLGNDGHCNYYPGGYATTLPRGTTFWTGNERSETFSVGASVWGAGLTSQSGFSSNVRYSLRAGYSTSTAHWYCGIDNAPGYASVVFAGP